MSSCDSHNVVATLFLRYLSSFFKCSLRRFTNHFLCLCVATRSPHNTEQGEIPKNVFMVFEYLEYDLTGLLEKQGMYLAAIRCASIRSPGANKHFVVNSSRREIRFTQDHIKSWSQQLLSGVHYMHINKVTHRDLKASNLLINRNGGSRLRIGASLEAGTAE